eukprot:jgi/Ulvmu1/5855/UM025_0117.1
MFLDCPCTRVARLRRACRGVLSMLCQRLLPHACGAHVQLLVQLQCSQCDSRQLQQASVATDIVPARAPPRFASRALTGSCQVELGSVSGQASAGTFAGAARHDCLEAVEKLQKSEAGVLAPWCRHFSERLA